jgi:hypothetical protein
LSSANVGESIFVLIAEKRVGLELNHIFNILERTEFSLTVLSLPL